MASYSHHTSESLRFSPTFDAAAVTDYNFLYQTPSNSSSSSRDGFIQPHCSHSNMVTSNITRNSRPHGKKRRCREYRDVEQCEGSFPIKRFISEEEMANHIQHLNIGASSYAPQSSKATRQLNIKTVASCQSSLTSKRTGVEDASAQGDYRKRQKIVLSRESCEGVGDVHQSRTEEMVGKDDHMTRHEDHMTKGNVHMTTLTNQTKGEDSFNQFYSTSSPSLTPDYTHIRSSSPTTTSAIPSEAITTLSGRTFGLCVTTREEEAGGDSEMMKTTSYSVDQDSKDVQHDGMSESMMERQSTAPNRERLCLTDVLSRKCEVTLEDVSSDSDGGANSGPERPLSFWIAPELQESLNKKSLLPPSVLEEINKSKGMEIVPWVNPYKHTVKPQKSSEDVEEMTEECTAIEEKCNLQRMESVEGESQSWDCNDSEMDSDS